MFELLLMRHAKSDWSQNLTDIDRPLNERGRNDALKMGEHLRHLNIMPDRMLVSTAERTRETAMLLQQSISLTEQEIFYEQSLYLASFRTICEMASRYAEDDRRLLILAHNPGMDDAIYYLSEQRPTLTANGKLMTTSSIAYFEIASNDYLKRPGQNRLVDILRPASI
jgi:phosphohistidine phosphatase